MVRQDRRETPGKSGDSAEAEQFTNGHSRTEHPEGMQGKHGMPPPSLEPVRKPLKVLILDDTPEVLAAYQAEFGALKGVTISTKKITSQAEAISLCEHEKPDIVITDLCLRSDMMHGFAILKTLREILPDTIVALSTSVWDPQSKGGIIERIRSENFDYVFQKADIAGMKLMIEREACKGSG